jgi:site-specific DNA-methyltransferase (adenine-specific)
MNAELHCGDCLEFMRGMKTGSVNLVLTDPPFASSTPSAQDNGTRKWAWRRSYADFNPTQRWWDLIAMELGRVMSADAQIYVFCDSKAYSVVYPTIYEITTGVVQALVWDKGRQVLGKHYRYQTEFIIYGRNKESLPLTNDHSNILKFTPVYNKEHSSEKPLDLISFLVNNSTTTGQVVFDPFMGSGPTGVACVNLGRSFVGVEIDPEHFSNAEKRIVAARFQPQLMTCATAPVIQGELPR